MTFTAQLYNAQQAQSVWTEIWPKVKAYVTAGNKLDLIIKKGKKSRSQEAKYHAMVGEIAKSMKAAGSSWSADDWKRLLIDQWAKETGYRGGRVVPSLDGERVVQLGIQSRDFNRECASEFIEWLHAWAVDKGLELSQ